MPHPLRLMVTDAAADVPLAGRDRLPLLISVRLEAEGTGPFRGDPADVALTVDYARVARFILEELPRRGPFPDLPAVARDVADFTYALDPRVCAVQISLRPADGGGPGLELEMEREDG